jgi:hypothetical protein
MQKLTTPFLFVFTTLATQLAPTNAGIAPIIARARAQAYINAGSSVQTIISSLTEDEFDVEDNSMTNTNLHSRTLNVFDEHHIQESSAAQEEEKEVLTNSNNERRLDHEFNYEQSYQQQQQYKPRSKMTKGQKIGLISMLGLTIALGIYSCVLRYELSTLNVYSLLGVYTSTREEEEEKVGDAYGSRVEMC